MFKYQYDSFVFNLRALETLWSIPTTNIEEYAEIDRKVNIDNSKNASFERSAEAGRSLKVSQALDERATWLYRSTRLSTLAQVLICIGQVPVVAEVQVKKRRLRETKSAREVLGAICLYSTKDQEVVVIFIRRKMRRGLVD
ncbi:hypothetical protein AT4G12543 [Arabidopsis thaliana]|uniref:Uncharacterized protein n=1 Tax=Arabidopsis thaliana TaxID=3702 RepID=A0A1P8B453_ARATH|nr:uncharacterized protein AT4G12543 [Arabidopsis thaliana]ANM66345.1 hypothetical protein AT4G12543 [Arabidopsis thaliana]|eukprot:NP_001328246.1 hypothetical protein AT4G12543 [Arabidopsis thaliana]